MDFYRVPLNGRNFEYMTGEDPYLGSQLAPSEIKVSKVTQIELIFPSESSSYSLDG
jgi:hypothetical protein